MKTFKRYATPILVLATSTAVWLPSSAQAVDFTLSGQVNRLVAAIDNGEEDGLVHADNSASGTRWRIKGEGEIGDGISAGLYYENQLQSNPSSKITEDSLDSDGIGGDVGGGDDFSVRHSNLWFKGDFGKVTLGQGDGAANGVTEIDKSGTGVIQYTDAGRDLLGSMEYGDSGVTVGDVRDAYDGLGRNDNIRYDAAIDKISFAGSAGNGDKVELSAKYTLENFQVMAAVWDEKDSGDDVQGEGISASWIGDSGLNLTGSYSGNDSDGDPTNVYFKVGFVSGDNAYAVDWGETQDKGPGDATSVSVAWVNNLMQGIQVYASYRIESVDDVANDDDVTALVGGARIKF